MEIPINISDDLDNQGIYLTFPDFPHFVHKEARKTKDFELVTSHRVWEVGELIPHAGFIFKLIPSKLL